ncbi:MAG: MFS transporter [Betaproteobacteria bacterium]|nr:MFS transporter [Betaproteobacteria bacterium]
MPVAARLAAYYFAFFAHAGAYVSYFSLYLAARGLSAGEIGFCVAMPQAARIVAPALWGWLADAWGARYAGARRAIIVFSAFAMLAGFVSLQFQERTSAIALTLFLLSLFSAGASPMVEAITFSALEGKAGGRAGEYGPIRLWGSIGFILAVMGVGAWLDRAPASILIYVLIGLSSMTCVAALALPAGTAHAHQAGQRLGAVLRRPEVLAFFAACFCMTAAHGTLYVFYSIFLEQAGYSKTLIGALWTVGVIAEIVLFLRLPEVMRRFSLRALLLASFVCAVLRFLAIGWAVDSFLLLAAAQLLHAATFGVFHAGSVAAVHRLFPGALAARGQALYSSIAYGLGGAAGSLIAGWSWVALGPSSSFALSALFGAGGAILVAWKVRV